ncbi:MAG TPA: alkaline phosphatase family protein [Candidatus Dormibacteraeota bacterium]|nr:alkaline phosphatase family protein [Candidatus Dormibacteraeota bacterium]
MLLKRLAAPLAGGVILAAVGLTPAPAWASSVPALDHVFVIVMENHSYGEIIGSPSAPYVNSVVKSGGLATDYFGVTHPSLPNYLALTGASTFGISSDCTTCWVSAGNIADALESAGRTWKAYEESMPSACFVGDSYPYAQKHDPFIYFNDIRTNTSRCQSHVVPYSQLASDLQSTTTTPSFAFITPNMCNDMHDCSVGTGDSWLQQQVPAILSSPAFKTQHSLLALTWDEDDSSGANQVPLILVGSGVTTGLTSAIAYNHYSLLHTIEASLGATTLTANDAGASVISDILSPAPAPNAAVTSNAAAALPQDMLHFGLANQPTDLSWMTSSGVPWRYRYQYLSAGVNTGSGWETWDSPAGQFATLYMSASAASGYIPVFSYYELLQSSPSTGTNESDRDYSNLNNTGTMAAYYANFKLLMQKAGAFNSTVVVHVEPDLWGYLEQRAAGGAASTVSASVASSGFAEAAGLPNTAQGFAFELLKLRDTYAPKTVLAIHASPWGSGVDIASDRRSSVSATAEADTTAAFLNSAGVASNPYGSTWDLVFNDIDDHDAGWWEQQGADNASFTHWWDPSNVNLPNFSRYLAWVAELHARTARPQVVWQVPVGNQYYTTMNNTCGHYQDNVGPYFIAHASSLYSAGLIAVLFGAGNSCQTNNTDVQHDGVTNNNGLPTTDLAGYCNACNTHASTVSDDDGGYLRVFVGQYYGATACPVTLNLPGVESTTEFGLSVSVSCSTSRFDIQQFDTTLNQGWFALASTTPTAGASSATADGYPGHAYQFRARALLAGGVWSSWTAATTTVSATATQSHPYSGLYTMDGYGGVNADSSPPLAASAYWPGWKIARAVHAQPSVVDAGLVLDGWGGLHPYGAAITVSGAAYWPGWDIARDFAFLPDGSGGYVLDGWGGLHPFAVSGHALPPAATGAAYWPHWDIARKVVIFSDGSGGYVMDAWGGLHPFGIGGGTPAAATGAAYWPGWNIARDVVLIPGTHAGYVLDGYGGLHPFNGAPTMAAPAYWPGWDIARGVWLLPGSTLAAPAGYTLDGYGGLHPFGGAPALTGTPYWPGWDIAKSLAGA